MDAVKQAIKILKAGGIIIFPTDTAFGIGCRIDDENAVKRLFTLRKRPNNQAVPVLVSDFSMAQNYLQPVSEDIIKKLVRPYWPGALTIVLPCKTEKVPSLVRGGGETLGVRMPNSPTTLEIIKGVGVPILGPSANFSKGKTPIRYEDLDQDLIKLIDYVVPGDCAVGQVSTVIDCTKMPWKILRQGAIQWTGK